MKERLVLMPLTAEVSRKGYLVVGGCDTVELAREFGTPLYLFDEFTIRTRCREYRAAFSERYPESSVIYAGKAFLNGALARLLAEEGMGLDVVSVGELGIAQKSGFPASRIYFHGNNKSAEELTAALKYRIGRIVVDNAYELEMLEEIAAGMGQKADILLRLSPGVDPHTHHYIATGIVDSKFGFTMPDADRAVARALAASHLNLVGLHFHLGSQISETEPYQIGVEVVLKFAAEMKRKRDFELRELNIGGGYAVRYTRDKPVPQIGKFAEAICGRLTGQCRELGLNLPHLVTEPGRAIVGQAGVALYRAGAIKDIPGVRRYVSVDGGMGDNIRPALYQAKYVGVVANNMLAEESDRVTIAGKFCESGDILVRDIDLPAITPGDIIAIPVSGAYCLSMASNYNASFRPAVVMVKEGQARLVRRRETLGDLTRCDTI
ncbi:MAG: diaminopimelate decarboxylase [Chloroflexota bacterium]